MFGGLEVKGNSSSKDGGEVPPPAGSSSAFGFLNVLSTPEPAPATAATSSFGFLNSASAPKPAAPFTPAGSGFSFMMHDMAAPEPPLTSDPAPVPASSDMSGFSFLIPSPSSDAADVSGDATAVGGGGGGGADALPTVEETPRTSSEDVPDPPNTGFSFLLSSIPEPDFPTGTTETQEHPVPSMVLRSVSSGSASSGVGPPALSLHGMEPMTHTPASSLGLPAGTGITFGTSSKRNVVKKKKVRAQRVGSAANTGVPSTGPPAPAVSAQAPRPTETESRSAREEAAEAAQRAEAFMQAKAMEEAKALAAPPAPVQGRLTSEDSSLGPPEIKPSASTDEVVAAAQAAAKEAKILQQQHLKGGGFMGTFFKGFRVSPTTTITGATGSSHGAEGVDRLAKEQQSTNRTMTERQMNLQQQRTMNQDNDDDDDVVISTSVGGYTPEIFTPSPPPASSFEPVKLPEVAAVPSSTASATTSNIAANQSSSAFSSSKQQPGTVGAHEFKISSHPSPKKMKTPNQMFEEYQALFAQSVHRAMDQVENVRSQQKVLLEERFLALAKDRLATQQIAQTERQLQVAVEKEEYELADQLGQVVEGHKREKQEVALMLENITRALAQLKSQKSLVMKSVATCFDNLSVRLEELKDKEAALERKDDEETFKQFSSISKQLSAEQERLQQDLKHLERDEQLVSEERKELEDSIKEQTGEIEIQKNETSKKLDHVQKEIDELRKLLELKQNEAAELRTAVFGFEDSISKVRVKFSRQLTRLDKKERALKESRSEWEIEDATHKRQKEAHELQVQSHSEALLVHDALMENLESELKLSKEFCAIIPTQLGFGDGEQNGEGESGDGDEGDLAQLQVDVVNCEAAVGEAKVILKIASSVLANLQAERETLERRIPELEAQKKAAATSRDFKAASKSSKEIRDATMRIKECEEELEGEALSKKLAAEEELERLKEELVKSKELASAKAKIAGQQKMVSLAKQIAQLIEKKKEICGDCSSEENSVRGVGALVLEGQIKAFQIEGQELGNKFGGWTELTKQMHLEMPPLSNNDVFPDDSELPSHENEQQEPSTQQEPMSAARVDDGLTSEERIVKVRQLMVQISEAEKALDAAASREDFDEAVRLEEVFQSLQAEVEKMNLTDEEAELAMEVEGASVTPENDVNSEQAGASVEESALAELEEESAELEEESAELEEESAQDERTSAQEEKKETSDETLDFEGENAGPIKYCDVDEDEAEAEAIEDGEKQDSTANDQVEQPENVDLDIPVDDETELSPRNGDIRTLKEIDVQEAICNAEQNGDGLNSEVESTKLDSLSTAPDGSTSE